jgi:hypothetical protein
MLWQKIIGASGEKNRKVITADYIATVVSSTTTATYTFSRVALGDAFPGRVLILQVSNPGTVADTVTSTVTVAGASATKINKNGNATAEVVAVFSLQMDENSLGDIVVTFDRSVSSCRVAIWSLRGASSAVVTATPNAINNGRSVNESGTYVSFNGPVEYGDVLISANLDNGTSSAMTITGASLDYVGSTITDYVAFGGHEEITNTGNARIVLRNPGIAALTVWWTTTQFSLP